MSRNAVRTGLHPIPSDATGLIVQVRPTPSIHALFPAKRRTISTALAARPVTFDCPPTVLSLDALCGVRSDTWRLHIIHDPATFTGYPVGFGNVHSDGLICWGTRNPVPSTFAQAHNQFWSAPFNYDLTRGRRPDETQTVAGQAADRFDAERSRHQTAAEAEVRPLFPRINHALPALDAAVAVRTSRLPLLDAARAMAGMAQAMRVPWYAPIFMTDECIADRIAQVVRTLGACEYPRGTGVTTEAVKAAVAGFHDGRGSAMPGPWVEPLRVAMDALAGTVTRYGSKSASCDGSIAAMSPYRRRRIATLMASVRDSASAVAAALPEGWTLAPWVTEPGLLSRMVESSLSKGLFMAAVNGRLAAMREAYIAAAVAAAGPAVAKDEAAAYYEGGWRTSMAGPVIPVPLDRRVLGLGCYTLPPGTRLLYVGFAPGVPAEYVLNGNTVIGTAVPAENGAHRVTLYTVEGKPGLVCGLSESGVLTLPGGAPPPSTPSVQYVAHRMRAQYTPFTGGREPAGSVVLLGTLYNAQHGAVPSYAFGSTGFEQGTGIVVCEGDTQDGPGIAVVVNGQVLPYEPIHATLRLEFLRLFNSLGASVLVPQVA